VSSRRILCDGGRGSMGNACRLFFDRWISRSSFFSGIEFRICDGFRGNNVLIDV
jgi:hypothetical protein